MANKVYGFTYKQDTEDKILTLKKFEMSYDDACNKVQMKAMGDDLGLSKLNNFMNSLAANHGYILVDHEITTVYCDSQEERDGAYNELKQECKDVEFAIIEKR